jgi:penicillin-binding protein 2
VTSLAGLEEGVITESTTVEDNGVITIGPFTFPNWYFLQYGKTEGVVNVVKALQRSNDIFFYKAGEWIGVTKLAEWARKVGIGAPLGIELSGEAGGLVPDPAWKKIRFATEADKIARNDEWYLGDTYHISIGQGYLLTTPLAVNTWTNIIANGGKLFRPTIRKITSLREEREQCKDLGLKKESVHIIMEGMEKACATGGTGWPLFNFSVSKATGTPADIQESSPSAAVKVQIPVACKTGTAEFGDPKNRTHAWFTAFAPIPEQYIPDDIKATENYIDGNPEISVTVLVEGAGEGSNVAAPIAKKIFEEWFSR